MTKIKKGLDIPISGSPDQSSVQNGASVQTVALLGEDYVGMRPTLVAQVGDRVKLGDVLFTDKKMEGVKYTSPGAGEVIAVNRGARRAFLSMVIRLDGSDEITFEARSEEDIRGLDRKAAKTQLIESGQWTALRARPFSKVADPATEPHAIFVNAMDSNPLSPDMAHVLAGEEENFALGIEIVSKLTDGTIFVCVSPELNLPEIQTNRVQVEEFDGPHPAGLVGTHIHFLEPVNRNKTVWHLGIQDVIAWGQLFMTGRIRTERVVSLGGPTVKQPRLIRTRAGACVADLVDGGLEDVENRVISGSVLSGRKADDARGFLGRYHQQITALEEGNKREFLGWLMPGLNFFTIKNLALSKLMPGTRLKLNTSTNGSQRTLIPHGNYETVVPLDILPTFLIRALVTRDLDEAEKLGLLELDEEDLALCTFSCTSKMDFGPILRENLTTIEKEG
ncbi:MAG: Na(+)-translocating NADH-quinone reductase subunit A [Candidatus Latescibacteria bacterium]|nr:Na(+)-translocating NADH-quinone reductase subunit A [Candidatus Latescibacterota bacterium]